MTTNQYHNSFLNKIFSLFNGVVISDLIYIHDESDSVIDNVCFFALNHSQVVGFYINGTNPLMTTSHIEHFDSFNLYSMYTRLAEVKSGRLSAFPVEYMKVVFHPDYNELIAILLSSADFLQSVLVVFSTDEIYVHENCHQSDFIELIKTDLKQFQKTDFLVFQKDIDDIHWTNV